MNYAQKLTLTSLCLADNLGFLAGRRTRNRLCLSRRRTVLVHTASGKSHKARGWVEVDVLCCPASRHRSLSSLALVFLGPPDRGRSATLSGIMRWRLAISYTVHLGMPGALATPGGRYSALSIPTTCHLPPCIIFTMASFFYCMASK